MGEIKDTHLFNGLTREAKKELAQTGLDAAFQKASEGTYRVFGKYDAASGEIVEVSSVQDAEFEILANGAIVNAHDLPNGHKAGDAVYLGTIKIDRAGDARGSA